MKSNEIFYIGIDPEPSGAWCIYDFDYNEVKFFTSYKDLKERAKQFEDNYQIWLDTSNPVFIEEPIPMPNQNIKAAMKTFISYGAWLGILYSVGMENVYTIPPRRWKSALGLSKDKYQSFKITMALINEEMIEYDKDELKLGPKVPEKQIYDRCESFLIARYGIEYLLSGV